MDDLTATIANAIATGINAGANAGDIARVVLVAMREDAIDGMAERAWVVLPPCEPDISQAEIARCIRSALTP